MEAKKKKTWPIVILVIAIIVCLFLLLTKCEKEEEHTHLFAVNSEGTFVCASDNEYIEGTEIPYIAVIGEDGLPTELVNISDLTEDETPIGNGTVSLKDNVLTYEGTSGQEIYLKTTKSSDKKDKIVIDAPNDELSHYGSATVLCLDQIKTSTARLNGEVDLVTLTKGRALLEEGSKVQEIYLDTSNENYNYETTIIAVKENVELPKLTRDSVELSLNETLTIAILENVTVEEETVVNEETEEEEVVEVEKVEVLQYIKITKTVETDTEKEVVAYLSDNADTSDTTRTEEQVIATDTLEEGTNKTSEVKTKEEVIVEVQGEETCKHEHTVTTEGVAAGCLTEGKTVQVVCSDCGEIITRSETISALGHNRATKSENVVAATCETDGSYDEVVYCTRCNEEFSRISVTLVKLGHTKETKNENVVDATCEADGSYDEVTYCTTCNKELSRETKTVSKLGHNLRKVAAVDKTCTTDGNIEYYVCDTCGKLYSDAEGTTEITLADTVISKCHELTKVAAVSETCVKDGNIEYYVCDDCGKYFSDADAKNEITDKTTVVVSAHGLTHTDAKAKTCTTDGNIEYYYCDDCDKYYSDKDAKNEITEESTVVDHDDKTHVSYVLQNDGSWLCAECDELLAGTDKAYFTVLKDGQPTTIIDLTATNVALTSGIYKSGNTITYTNSGTAQDVIIRTGSSTTTLNINDATDSKVYHYDEAGILNIIQCGTESFYERGKVGFVTLGIGRYVLTELSDVEVVNIEKKDANTYNNPIIADGGVLEENMPDIISRDQVEVTDQDGKTELVQIQELDKDGNVVGIAEQIYAYANGTAGTTEKTTTQNSTIASKLGLIVLDSNSKAGEKAYNVDQKSSKRDEVAGDAVDAAVLNENSEYIARIGYTGFTALTTALTTATSGQTVTMLANSQEAGLRAVATNVTLDMNGYSLTNTSGNIINQYGSGSLTIIGTSDSVISGNVRVYAPITFADSFYGKVTGNIVRAGGNLYINGGVFDGTFNNSSTKVEIAGGKFKTKPTLSDSLYCAEGKMINSSAVEGYYNVEDVTADNATFAVTVGDTTKYYVSLDTAQSFAINGGTIKLLKDFVYTGTYGESYVTANYSPTGDVTVDLNGHTLNLGNYTNFINLYSGTLTLTDSVGTGTIVSNNSSTPFKIYDAANLIVKNINCTSDKITLFDYNYDATGTTTLTNVTLVKAVSIRGNATFNDCDINAQVTVWGGSTLTVNGGRYKMFVPYSKATLNVNSGTIGYINGNNGGTINIATCIIDSSYEIQLSAPSFNHCTVVANGTDPESWTVNNMFAGGTGTAEDPFLVYDCASFKAIDCLKDDSKSYYFKVDIDKTDNGVIDLTDLVCDANNFKGITLNGSFDGSGVIFKNLVGDSALFRYVDTNDDACSVVENFTMDSSCNITRSYGASAVIRDLDAKTAVVRNITTYATINATAHSAALIGYINNTDNHAEGGSETISNCASVKIENCTIAGNVYTIGQEPASLLIGYSMERTDKAADVTISNCDISKGHLYCPSSCSTAKGYAYVAQAPGSNITIDGTLLTGENNSTLNAVSASQISKYSTIAPVQSGSGYTFEKAEGATSARIQLEARCSINGQKGCCFVIELSTIDISSKSGTIDIPDLSKITNVKLNGSDSYENMYVDGDGVMYLHLEGYDAGTASLAKLTVTQFDGTTVLSTGVLSLHTETDDN